MTSEVSTCSEILNIPKQVTDIEYKSYLKMLWLIKSGERSHKNRTNQILYKLKEKI